MGVTVRNYRPTTKPNVSKMPSGVRTRFEKFWRLYKPVITRYERDQKVDSDAFKAALVEAKRQRDLFFQLAERSQETHPKETQDAIALAYFHMDHMVDLERFAQSDDVHYKPKTCKEGDKGPHVRKYQEFLKFWKLYRKKVDGDYGDGTVSAVRKFQRKHKLKVDGTIGRKTAAKVVEIAVEEEHGAGEIQKIC